MSNKMYAKQSNHIVDVAETINGRQFTIAASYGSKLRIIALEGTNTAESFIDNTGVKILTQGFHITKMIGLVSHELADVYNIPYSEFENVHCHSQLKFTIDHIIECIGESEELVQWLTDVYKRELTVDVIKKDYKTYADLFNNPERD